MDQLLRQLGFTHVHMHIHVSNPNFLLMFPIENVQIFQMFYVSIDWHLFFKLKFYLVFQKVLNQVQIERFHLEIIVSVDD